MANLCQRKVKVWFDIIKIKKDIINATQYYIFDYCCESYFKFKMNFLELNFVDII